MCSLLEVIAAGGVVNGNEVGEVTQQRCSDWLRNVSLTWINILQQRLPG